MGKTSWPLALAILAAVPAIGHAQARLPANILEVPKDAPPPKAPPLGRYAVDVVSEPTLATHTVYRPRDLTQGKGRFHVVVWGNGACANTNTGFRPFLTKIASHGFVVIAIGPRDAPAPDYSRNRAGTVPTAATKGSMLTDALDWAEAENKRKGSPYFGRLDARNAAAMGQSCGGLQAIEVTGDPRVKTTVAWNSGVFVENGNAPPALSKATKATLKTAHGPMAYFIGGPIDVAWPNAEDDYRLITQVPVFKANLNVGHGGTYRHENGGWFGEVGAAWLEYTLNGDKAAARYFTGADCILCANPIWKVERKGFK